MTENGNKEKSFVSAVFYVHNDADILENSLKRIHDTLAERFSQFELICVNDASTDQSVEKIHNFAEKVSDCTVTILHMGRYHGIELSMSAGTDFSIGDFVFEFDSLPIDYSPNLIWEVYQKVLTGYDIVSAHPQKVKRKSSRLFYWIFNRFSNSSYTLTTERFRVLSRRAINRVIASSKARPYRKALYASSGLKSTSISYHNELLPYPHSKEQQRDRRNTAADTLILFTDVAYKLSLAFCVLMLVFMLVAGIYTCVTYFGQQRPVEGWAPLMGMLSAGFFGIFLILTLVVKYLDIILKLIFQRQKYMITSIEKIK